jgi:hypothetical protein
MHQNLLELNITIEDTGTKNCLSNTKLYFWPDGASMHMAKPAQKGAGISLTQIICLLIGSDQKFTIFLTS